MKEVASFATITTIRSTAGFVPVKKMLSRTSNNLLFLLVMIVSVTEPQPLQALGHVLGRVSFSLSRAVVGYVAPIVLRGVLSIATRALSSTYHSPCNEDSGPAS